MKFITIASLLVDILIAFVTSGQRRLTSRALIRELSNATDRPWMELPKASALNDRWLAHQLRPYDVRPKHLRFGQEIGRGYLMEDFEDVFRRYISRADLERLTQQLAESIAPLETSLAPATSPKQVAAANL